MKRIITLLLAATLAIGSVGVAKAVDVKVKGTWDWAFSWVQNGSFYDNDTGSEHGYGREADNFGAYQRLRTQINVIASESLQGVVMFEIGTIQWGQGGSVGRSSGGALDADGVNVETKRAYLDWMIPDTDISVRMGIQALNLPMANGYANPVFSADVAALVVNYKVDDMFGITAFWARPFDQYTVDANNRSLDDEMDLFGLMLPITGEGWSLTPWGMYGQIGTASGYLGYLDGVQGDPWNTATAYENTNTEAWWLGMSFSLDMFDPLTFGMDVMYGDMHRANWGPLDYTDLATGTTWTEDVEYGTRGWFVAAALNYQLDWGTPGLFGWWSSGDTAAGLNAGKGGAIPVVGIDDGFAPTSFGFPGSAGPVGDSAVGLTAVGTWGIGIQLADVSFIENLSHTLRFAYYRGTNENEVLEMERGINRAKYTNAHGNFYYLTDEDQAFEVNFDHKYQIYENLAAYLELGWIKMDLDETWKDRDDTDDAWKAQVLFKYSF